LFKIGGDHIHTTFLVGLVIKSLLPNPFQMFGVGTLEFYYANGEPVLKNCTIGLARVLLVPEFGSKFITGLRIHSVPQHLDEKFAEKSRLELLLLRAANILLDLGIVEKSSKFFICFIHLLLFLQP